ncbi:hypothetical protein B0T14DRAFT_333383 [Immersiella caudata]|uniref:Uncharacterized protein n=1 Tax=Immersiella caudata TaxID=314043 RepID=A0AA39THP6_9PEZI|nr:hypothetical protein B0T14DRAFT_333383 [Immersiella caudata]
MAELCSQEGKSVYLIFHVFKMLSEKVDVRLYVNPVELERQRTLHFSPDNYTVTPTANRKRKQIRKL